MFIKFFIVIVIVGSNINVVMKNEVVWFFLFSG